MTALKAFEVYWRGDFLAANGWIGLNLLGALLLGMIVGYERSYNGRAAGMRTYGLVCMAATALTVFAGYAPAWFGGRLAHIEADPTKVVQGVVTGIGFLCAGVIVKDGLSISGLTTAASIWAAAAIGVLIGVELYGAALLLALLCMLSMTLVGEVERRLPGRAAYDVSLTFRPDAAPAFEDMVAVALAHGYRVARDSFSITYAESQPLWRFSVMALDRSRSTSPALLAQDLARSQDVARFSIVPVRN
jgi:putative Mg2+ transporter-C (MgtC) family protein